MRFNLDSAVPSNLFTILIMSKPLTLTWIILVALTLISASFAQLGSAYTSLIVLALSVFKFIGIAFQFMEIKKAHAFWKIIILAFVLMFSGILFVSI